MLFRRCIGFSGKKIVACSTFSTVSMREVISSSSQRRTQGQNTTKILSVLYDDPITGYPQFPNSYYRGNLPDLPDHYPDGSSLPTPDAIDYLPGVLLGSVSGELGLRPYLESLGHIYVVTSNKEGANSKLDQELADAEILISQPFYPAYLTAERIAKAPNLKLAITAGAGSDHVDLQAAMDRNITVAEVTYSNSISVAEHTVMMILALVRNYLPSHSYACTGGWNIADCAAKSYDLEGMKVGLVGAGRIGLAVLRRLKPFDVVLHYTDKHRLPKHVETELGALYHPSAIEMAPKCDVLSIHCPLHQETHNLFNHSLISSMKRGSYIVNTARGRIVTRDAVVDALESGQLAGYAGDVWYPQPAPIDHPWRTMPHHGMTPHTAGTTLAAQARYAAGVREILECWFEGRPIRDDYIIVRDGKLAGVGAHSYSKTSSSAEGAMKDGAQGGKQTVADEGVGEAGWFQG